MEYIPYVAAVLVTIGLLLMLRNLRVYKIRMAILFEEGLEVSEAIKNYNKLPDYDYMMVRPSQWTLWTVAQYKRKYVK